jgi:hypothetical protein
LNFFEALAALFQVPVKIECDGEAFGANPMDRASALVPLPAILDSSSPRFLLACLNIELNISTDINGRNRDQSQYELL